MLLLKLFDLRLIFDKEIIKSINKIGNKWLISYWSQPLETAKNVGELELVQNTDAIKKGTFSIKIKNARSMKK